MDSVNKTLYIPLYGKAYVSRKGIILRDKKAEKIWEKEGFPLKGKSKSKWLAYYMGMRSAVFDQWLKEQMTDLENAAVIHLGCGMDSRIERIGFKTVPWYDVDFPDVIEERRHYYSGNENYHMIPADIRESEWINNIPEFETAIIVMEGVGMYIYTEQLKNLLANIKKHFSNVRIMMDCYTTFAARMSKIKNPINDVGGAAVYGIDEPKCLEADTGLFFVKEHDMTPQALIDELQGLERTIFKKIYAGNIAKKTYRLYEYKSN